MKARSIFIFVALVVVLGGVVLLSPLREPSYQGRSLTSWLQQCKDTGFYETQRLAQAQNAVRAMPVRKVLPRLLKLAETTDDPVSLWVIGLTDKFRIQFLKWHTAEDFQQLGIAGFEALGTNAAPAVEELTKLLDDKKRAFVAVRCLAAIGKPAEASICKALSNPDSEVRQFSIVALAAATDDVEVYINRLTNSLHDPDINVRLVALRGIALQRAVPDLVVPILIKELSDDGVSDQATEFLADFGTNAAAAFPIVSNLAVNGPSGGRTFNVANEALRTLAIIAPDRALPMVFQSYRSSNGLRRLWAFGLLCAYSPTTPEIEATIKRATDDPDMMISRRAKRFLTDQYLQAHPIESQFSNEPVYGGKSLGEWLKMHDAQGKYSKEAQDALRGMGTNAIPALLARLIYVQPPYGLRAFQINIDAVTGFIVLGDQAKPVLPELQVLMDGTNQNVVVLAMLAASGTGSNAIPLLTKGLTNQFADVRNEAANTLCQSFAKKFPAQCQQAIPLLVKLLNDPDQNVRGNATNELKEIDPTAAAKAGIK
jgi:HEAT repeat protein